MGAVGNSVVGSGGDNHTDYTTNNGYDSTNKEGNSSPDSLSSQENDYDEHDYDEDEADRILGF